jgi:flagellar L-ring protein precursor FlgH
MMSFNRAQKCNVLFIVPLVVTMCMISGCASLGKQWKSLVGGGKDSDSRDRSPSSTSTPKFSDQENYKAPSTEKQYRRMNKQRFEEEAEVKEDAGSLWVMEGQGAYLFAQNQMRMVGDLLNVKIDGSPKTQLQTKVKVISKLLERLENPRGLASVQPAAGGAAPAAAAEGAKPAADGAKPQVPGAPGAPAVAGAEAADGAQAAAGGVGAKPEPPFSVQSVPTRIVEQLKDGSYRVRGQQPFMIGKREYKVIVTGVVRSEDFDDAGIEATKLLDPQFDIVSSRKGASM